MTIELDRDLETIFLCAIRYSMGRRTYMPSLVCDYIRPLLPGMSDYFLRMVLQEYDFFDRIYEGKYGDECDKITWMDFKSEVKHEIEKRAVEM